MGYNDTEHIEISVEILYETNDAFRVTDGAATEWVPKSQMTDTDFKEGDHVTIELPEWLALEKGFI